MSYNMVTSKSPSRWVQRDDLVSQGQIRIHYSQCPPPSSSKRKGTIVLLHGFLQTSHQYRHIILQLSEAGYNVIAPDYGGAGRSSKPPGPFTKSTMAGDLFELVHDCLGINESVHLVGHDIGGMVAHAYASRYPEHVASIVWGECPLPGTSSYEEDMGTVRQFHFTFHAVGDLPEALVAGRERIYLKHFFDKLAYNAAAISDDDLEHYVLAYSQPGALRCAFATYSAFEQDAAENKQCLLDNGKCKIPSLVLSGDRSGHASAAARMGNEMYEDVRTTEVRDSGHYISEEAPTEFVEKILEFVAQHHQC